MAGKLRLLLTVLFLACSVTGLVWLQGGDSARHTAREGTREPAGETFTHQDCARCHEKAWKQWSESAHARAWTSAEVQAAFQHFGHDRKCESCHAPEPVARVAASKQIRLRQTDRQSGIHCRTCHALPDGRVAAARTRDDVPCRPLAHPPLTTSRACGICHTAIYDDWKASRYREAGQTCHDCHMRSAPGEPSVSHACPGSTDEYLLRSGVRMTCSQREEQLVVEVTNHATGHNYPGERHHRVLSLEVLMHDRKGAVVLSRREVIKDITPFRGESSSEQIAVDQTFRAVVPIVAGGIRAEIRLLYKRFPWQPDWNAFVVHRTEMELGDAP